MPTSVVWTIGLFILYLVFLWKGMPASVVWTIGFFIVYLVVLCKVTTQALQEPRRGNQPPKLAPAPRNRVPTDEPLDPLGWEYNYALTTASEAMRDRQSTINYYLLIVGGAATGSAGLLGLTGGADLPFHLAGGLAWVVCCLGAFYFLILAKLRESWHGSARHLLEIRDFSVAHTQHLPGITLNRPRHTEPGAFLWHKETLPAKGKRWTVFYYSAMLIAFLGAVTFWLGAMLIAHHYHEDSNTNLCYFGALAALLFLWHDVFYEKLLGERKL